MRSAPAVSVVIPVYNDPEGLRRCLAALAKQTYPCDRVEVIVVDNASDVPLGDFPECCPPTRLLHEPRPGSYAARNRGLAVARGEVIAFTDADCTPEPEWLERGVSRLMSDPQCGLAAGRVAVTEQDPSSPTPSELYERITAFPQERYVRQEHFGVTANVFTWMRVIEDVGDFDASLESGGDREWGQRVHRAGYRITYAPDAVVEHSARAALRDLLAKERRVSRGLTQLLRRGRIQPSGYARIVIRSLVPPVPALLRVWRDERLRGPVAKVKVAGVFLVLRYARAANLIRGGMVRGEESGPQAPGAGVSN